MRLVGFQQSQRKRLEDFHSTSNPVTIANCTIKKARASDDLEILLKSASKLNKSAKKLKFPPKEKTFTNIPLKDLSGKFLYSTISVRAKVINVAGHKAIFHTYTLVHAHGLRAKRGGGR